MMKPKKKSVLSQLTLNIRSLTFGSIPEVLLVINDHLLIWNPFPPPQKKGEKKILVLFLKYSAKILLKLLYNFFYPRRLFFITFSSLCQFCLSHLLLCTLSPFLYSQINHLIFFSQNLQTFFSIWGMMDFFLAPKAKNIASPHFFPGLLCSLILMMKPNKKKGFS